MVKSKSSVIQLENNVQRFFIVLTSAACEWFLLFLLLIEAIFSFLLKKFASYCKLKIPCIFCSRLDHILGKETHCYYQGLVCNSHKLELSSLFSSYGKLGGSHDTCEECLLSSARASIPNHVKHDGMKMCSSCNAPLIFMQNGNETHCIKLPKDVVIKSNMHFPNSKTKMREQFSKQVSPNHLKKFGFDHLSHMGYSELKISSDSESDFIYSDDDEVKSVAGEKKVPKVVPFLHSRRDEPKVMKSAVSGYENDVNEKKIQNDRKIYPSSIPPSIPELITLDDFPPCSNAMEDSNAGSLLKKCELKFPLSQNLNPPVGLPELLSLIDDPPTINFKEVGPHQLQINPNGPTKIDNKSAPVNVREKTMKLVAPDNADLKGNDSFEFKEEKMELKGSESIRDTFGQTFMSCPKLLSQECESKAVEDSFSNGVQTTLAMNKTECGSELSSPHESVVSDIEGETSIDHLKRQVELYKTKISALYIELEEERSASAIAANQAMAMITRLQEEKASLHMEALQYLRMMEEQAEHDVEALEKANDLLAEREKEIQDLEAELEILRIMYSEEIATDVTQEKTFDLHGISKTIMNPGISETNYLKGSGSLVLRKVSNVNEEHVASKSPLMEFGNEKLFISECLKDLERKLVEIGRQQDSVGTIEGDDNGDEDTRNIEQVPPLNEKIDLVTLSNEISDLNERVEGLETDCNFLEHTLNSLEAGNEGINFVRDISHHLQELRKNCSS